MNFHLSDLLDVYLRQGLNNELKDNNLAAILYQLVKSRKLFTSSRHENVSYLINGIPPKELQQDENRTDAEIMSFKDMRFKHLMLCNLKKYPGDISANNFYGLSFCNKTFQPINSVFLGSNGVGKTSVYAALEYFGMGKMNSATERGYSRKIGEASDKSEDIQKDQSEFLLHSGKDFNESSIRMSTNSGFFTLDGNQLKENTGIARITEAFYCSAYDVRELETNDDYTQYILKQLGLNHFYHCLQDIYYLGCKVKSNDKYQLELDETAKNYNSEATQFQLLFGIVTNSEKIDLEDFKDNKTLEYLISLIGNSENIKEISEAIESLKALLREELSKFHKTNWYSLKVREEYTKCLASLAKIRKALQKDGFPIQKTNIIDIQNFLSFRKILVLRIADIKANLASISTSIEKDILIDDTLRQYIEARDKSENPILIEQEVSLFESQSQRETFWKEYYPLLKYLEGKLKEILNKWFPDIKKMVEGMLTEYFEIDNDQIKIDLNFNSFEETLPSLPDYVWLGRLFSTLHNFIEFKVEVMTSRGDWDAHERHPISPKAYLNTFKFKLFCVALKSALGCVVKKIYNVNYPMIIDDVFDSSDFDSRIKLKDFIHYIVEYHKDMIKDMQSDFQLIFFTQDDLIANQVYKGLTENNKPQLAKLSRIFDYHECDEEKFSFEDNGISCHYYSIEDIIK